MPDAIIDGHGSRNYLAVNQDGSINVSGTININNIAGSIVIGSVSAHVDSIYIQSGVGFVQSGNIFIVSGNAWDGTGSTYLVNAADIGQAPKSPGFVNYTTNVAATGSTLVLSGNTDRIEAVIQNTGSTPVYVGTNAVTTSVGIRLNPFDSFGDVSSEAEWWAVASGGVADVRIWEAGSP